MSRVRDEIVKILLFSSLFPNSIQNRHGIFVENRMRKLKEKYPELEIKVCAPVPWFPFGGKMFGNYGQYSKVPRFENRHGIEIYHPRYFTIPKIGMSLAPFLMTLSVLVFVWRFKKRFDFDLIDAHYFYPDGVAATLLARLLKKPFLLPK